MDERIMRFLAIILALREKYYGDEWRNEGNQTALGECAAYDNAYYMLKYAMEGDWNALRQFGWADEAEEILDRYDDALDLDTIKAIINQ